MLDLLLDRRWKKMKYSIGRLFAGGLYVCNTMEDTDRKLISTMNEATIKLVKVAGLTAIPLGTYDVRLTPSSKFKKRAWAKKYGGLVPEIVGVPGFSGVRIHPGNTASDTDGCPLVGDNKEAGKLCNSVKRYYELMDNFLMPAWKRGELIQITVR